MINSKTIPLALHMLALLFTHKLFATDLSVNRTSLYEKQKKDFFASFHQDVPVFPYTFVYDNNLHLRSVQNVYLRGSFNSNLGQKYSNITLDEFVPNLYKKTLYLPEGVYRYQIKIDQGDEVVNYFDFVMNQRELKGPNEYDYHNACYVGEAANYVYDRSEYLGRIHLKSYNNLRAIHNPDNPLYCSFLAPSLTRFMCRLTNDSATNVRLWFREKGSQELWNTMPMPKSISFGQWDYFCVTLNHSSQSQWEYFFEISDGIYDVYLGNDFYSDDLEEVTKHPFAFAFFDTREANSWACDAIWYQIFLDRFANACQDNDRPNTRSYKDWPDDLELKKAHEKYSWSSLPYNIPHHRHLSPKAIQDAQEQQKISYFFKQNLNHMRFGGDLQGLIKSIPYLKKLGINAVYLNPIFVGKESHHYHVLDLRHIDDVFGVPDSLSKISGETIDPTTWKWTESDLFFLEVIQTLHSHDIKVVIDIGLHSVHRDHPWFQDVLKNHEKSPYFEWFDSHKRGDDPHDIDYWTWDRWTGWNEMPLFGIQENLNYPDDLRYFLLSVVKRWLCPNGDPKAGVDGFRIDSPDSLPIFFLLDLQHLVKKFKPSALLINENWHRTSTTNISNIFDANADMEWTEQLHHYFVGKKKSLPEYLDYIQELFSFGFPQTVMSSWHAIGNHDTIRLAGSLENPEMGLHPYVYPYFEAQEPKEISWQRFQQIIAYQFTSFGAPYIYYGDEIGMWSKSDPFNRHPMSWDHINEQIWDFYRKMIAIRKRSVVLNRGNFELLHLNEEQGLFGFKRFVANQQMWMIFNRSSHEQTFRLKIDQNTNLQSFFDYLNPNHFTWKESDHGGVEPVLRHDALGHLVQDNELILKIKPWQSMILTVMD